MSSARFLGTVALFAVASGAFSQTPVIVSVQNAASGSSSAVVPQMLVSIYGSNLAERIATATSVPFPTNLAGSAVTFNGIPAPLLYVSGGQINAQVPSAVYGSISADVVVTTKRAVSQAFSVVVTPGSAPGIFTRDSSGCGQAAAFNIHANGSTSLNTPQDSFDPLKDAGFALFMTGIGPFSDRADGVPWSYNALDNQSIRFLVTAGAFPGNPGWPAAIAANVNAALTNLATSYAGPAPGLVGVDQVNAMYYNFGPKETVPLPEGCQVPLSLAAGGISDLRSQPANVSIHSGGGPCTETPANSLGMAIWQQNVTRDSNGIAVSSTVVMQFLQDPGILGFALPPVVAVPSVEDYGPLQPPLSFCAESYPATLDGGVLTATGPGRGPVSLQPQIRNGLITYQAPVSASPIQAGQYSIASPGVANGVGPFTAQAILPIPITISTDLQPGKPISLPFTMNWTGGGPDSVVTVTLEVHIPGQPTTPILSATSPALAGTRTLVAPPPAALFSFPPHADVEILVTQQPGQTPAGLFSAAGLTLGGAQSWSYVFDFKGLKAQ